MPAAARPGTYRTLSTGAAHRVSARACEPAARSCTLLQDLAIDPHVVVVGPELRDLKAAQLSEQLLGRADLPVADDQMAPGRFLVAPTQRMAGRRVGIQLAELREGRLGALVVVGQKPVELLVDEGRSSRSSSFKCRVLRVRIGWRWGSPREPSITILRVKIQRSRSYAWSSRGAGPGSGLRPSSPASARFEAGRAGGGAAVGGAQYREGPRRTDIDSSLDIRCSRCGPAPSQPWRPSGGDTAALPGVEDLRKFCCD